MARSTETVKLPFATPVKADADHVPHSAPGNTASTDGKPTRHERLLDRGVALALATFSLGIAIALLKAGVSVTLEDGYYYFKIAQHLARGEGSTFDGLHPTNGYHPLWLFCLVPIFWLKTSPTMALALGTLLQGLLMATGAALLYFTLRRTLGRTAASFSTLVWLRLTYPLELSGLEFSLHALGITMAAYLYVNLPEPNSLPKRRREEEAGPASSFILYLSSFWKGDRFYLMLGLILSLTFLARLETILLAGVLGLWIYRRERQAGWTAASPRRVLALTGPVAAVFLLYVGANVWWFGHPLPVSSSIKRDWSAYLLARDPLYQAHGWAAAKLANLLWPLRDIRARYPLAIGAFGVPLLYVIACITPRPAAWLARLRRALQPYGSFVIFSALQFLAAALLYHDEMSFTPWYYVAQPWLTALLAGIAFEEAGNLTPRPPSLIRLLRRQRRGRLKAPFALETEPSRNPSPVRIDRLRWRTSSPFPVSAVSQGRDAQRRTLAVALGKGVGGLGSVVLALAWCVPPVRIALSVRQWQTRTSRHLVPEPLQTAARWIRSHLPPDAIIGSWNAGTIGYLSQRRVVNLDGLVNSWEYYRSERHDLCRYWQRSDISYIVDAFDGRNALALVPTLPSYALCRDRLELVWEDDTTTWKDNTYVWTADGRPAHWRMAAYRVSPTSR